MNANGRKIRGYFKSGLGKISDAEFDNLVYQAVQKVYPVALENLSIDEKDAEEPVWMLGPPHNLAKSKNELKVKKGRDKIIRYMPVGITIYNFAEHSILIYQCNLDPVNETALNECTHEFFYNDIVSFQTVTQSSSITQLNWGERMVKKLPLVDSFFSLGKLIQLDRSLSFILTTAGGSKLVVPLEDSVLKQHVKGGKFSLDQAKKSVGLVRRTIRSKKSYSLSLLSKSLNKFH